MKAQPTEEELGIAPTPEEMEVLSRPAPAIHDDPEDDIPRSEEDDIHQVAKPKPEGDEKPKREKDPETGKFVAKPKEDGDAVAPPPKGFVDQRALQEERALRRQTEERMQVLLDTLQKREAREAKKDEPPAPAAPTLDTDPLAFIGHIAERLGSMENESKAQRDAREAYEGEQAEIQQVYAVATPQFAEASIADPTLPQLQNALTESLAREICFVNRIDPNTATPQQRALVQQELTKLEASHVRYAVSNGINVADYVREFAASRGISLAAQQQQAPAQAPQQRPIADRQRAQDRHLSIGDLPGSAMPDKINMKDLAKMDAKQFAAFAKKLGDAGMDEIFGKA